MAWSRHTFLSVSFLLSNAHYKRLLLNGFVWRRSDFTHSSPSSQAHCWPKHILNSGEWGAVIIKLTNLLANIEDFLKNTFDHFHYPIEQLKGIPTRSFATTELMTTTTPGCTSNTWLLVNEVSVSFPRDFFLKALNLLPGAEFSAWIFQSNDS